MHHFIYSTKDSWISSGSNKTTGNTFTDQNFGQDQILELRKEYYNLSFDYPTRMLVQFDLTNISKSIEDGLVTTPNTNPNDGCKFFLRMYEAEGNKEQSLNHGITVHAISQSWDEGIGKFGDNPKTTTGCSWNYRQNPYNGTSVSWSASGSSYLSAGDIGAGVSIVASQSFSSSSPDIEVDVTDIIIPQLSSSQTTTGLEADMTKRVKNYGMVARFTGSQETDSEVTGHLKYFSTQTHTIYSPKLEVRWDDHNPATGSNTGSLSELTMSGLADNYLYMRNLKPSYKEAEKVKFRVGARKQFIQKTFSASFAHATGSYIPEGSGSYAITDVATGETIVPFSAYTSMSCDAESNYFIQWMNGFSPDRVYKIMLRLKTDDGQEQIFDNNFEFIVKR